MKQLENRQAMLVAALPVGGGMVGMRMNNRYPVHNMNMGKRHNTSQIYDK